MQVVGQKIAQLEARKRAAVEREDYDTAKLIKVTPSPACTIRAWLGLSQGLVRTGEAPARLSGEQDSAAPHSSASKTLTHAPPVP